MPEFVKKDHDYSAVESYLQNNDVNITNDLTVGGNLTGNIPLRDYIINGSFKYWLDNTGISSTYLSSYTATLAYIRNIGGSCSVSRESHAVGQTSIPTNSPYYLRNNIVGGSSSGDLNFCVFYLEDVRKYSDKTQTLSIWCKSSSGNPYICIEAVQQFGTGGSLSAEVVALSLNKVQISTSWTRYDTVISWPSISGKTLGTDSNSRGVVLIWFSSGSNWSSRNNNLGSQSFTCDIAKVQLIDGDKYQYIPERSENEELAMIGRYYEKSYEVTTAPGSLTEAGVYYGAAQGAYDLYSPIVSLKTIKRNIPVITYYSPSTGASGYWRNLSTSSDYAVTLSGVNVTTGNFSAGQNNSLVAGNVYLFHWVADARF